MEMPRGSVDVRRRDAPRVSHLQYPLGEADMGQPGPDMGLDQGGRGLPPLLVSSILSRGLLLLQEAALRRAFRSEHSRTPIATLQPRYQAGWTPTLLVVRVVVVVVVVVVHRWPRDILAASSSADEHLPTTSSSPTPLSLSFSHSLIPLLRTSAQKDPTRQCRL